MGEVDEERRERDEDIEKEKVVLTKGTREGGGTSLHVGFFSNNSLFQILCNSLRQ